MHRAPMWPAWLLVIAGAVALSTTSVLAGPESIDGAAVSGHSPAAAATSTTRLAAQQAPAPLRLRWPLELRGTLPGLNTVAPKVNFTDHDPAFPGSVSDYEFGTRSYDRAGGQNHSGTDLTLWPAPWAAMDAEVAVVVAAADGVIEAKADGRFDRNCLFNADSANFVRIRHDNGWASNYLHLKSGSVTRASVGERVRAGDVLGSIGSSGNSTAPHLHFEVFDRDGRSVDPWLGPGNPDITESLWVDQRDYWETEIVAVTSGSAVPTPPACGRTDFREQTRFDGGDRVVLTTYVSEIPDRTPLRWTLREPDGAVFGTFEHDSAGDLAVGYWFWSLRLPANAPEGTWTYDIDVGASSMRSAFSVGGSASDRMCQGRMVTVDIAQGQTPTNGDDVILGTPGPDEIHALAGNDTVCGRGGADVIRGGSGNDAIGGGGGADLLIGGAGNDYLRGGSGRDRLRGNKGNDDLMAGAGNDRLWGGSGHDRIRGNSGNDTLRGNGGRDDLRGGKGTDVCVGGAGRDSKRGCEA